MIYDGYDLGGVVRVEGVTRRLLPPISLPIESYEGLDGGQIGSVTLEPLEIVVSLRMIRAIPGYETQTAELEEARRELAARLFRRTPCELVLDEPGDITYKAICKDAGDLTRLAYSQSCNVTFICPDPVGYGEENEISVGTSGAIYVGGNYPARPTFEVSTTAAAISLTVDGVEIQTTGTTTGDDPIVIDCEAEATTKGTAAVGITITSDYPALSPGRHEIACAYPVTVRWADRWL